MAQPEGPLGIIILLIDIPPEIRTVESLKTLYDIYPRDIYKV